MQVYPNPVTAMLTVELPAEDGWIQVYDALGQLRQVQEVAGKTTQVDLRGYAPGLYCVVTSGGTKKWVVKG